MQLISKSIEHTLKIGRMLAKYLKKRDIICLIGQLGSGKTVLVKGIAEGLGIKSWVVKSPSFILIHEYKSKNNLLYHLDLYRLKNPIDTVLLGYEEYLYNEGICVIEWAERLNYLMPKEYLKINFYIVSEEKRLLKFIAYGRRYKELLKRIYEDIRH
ncbi:MAG: tRNA (adenosine(37)-N6)-threonylcarbamoyltransferase complex ATPase subunit type 1 TsaE [Candidatus Omnitrophica bacterium]|nr:tRNA (adenosine(37)-N6)-threonylcarbamoyltransferase complex ATPase subunit type 1 TsaE [Candidatus Omnitrophota bacterium]